MNLSSHDILQIVVSVGPLILISPFLGTWIARMLDPVGARVGVLGSFERGLFRMIGIQENHEMNAKEYGTCVVLLSLFGFLFLYLLQVCQVFLPFNPEKFPGLSWHLAFNTAVSFVTNTNWQSYGGETTMSYLTQMLGLGVQNFVSAAVGITVLLALSRGLRQNCAEKLGNFWKDLTRTTLYVLLPMSLLLAIVLIGQGVVQSVSPYPQAHTMEGVTQSIPLGPAASQIAIKQLGTNGGGFFNANSAHPFENPTPFSNWIELLSLLLIPASLCFSFGIWIRQKRHGIFLFSIMFFLLLCGIGVSLWSETGSHVGMATEAQGLSHSPLMEGKETRFGIIHSILWSVFTTDASNGSVNAMHSSLTPIAGAVAMVNMMLGEIIFGGVGSGIYGMVLFILLTVFASGLMIGRTPEYLGKKIEAPEVKMAILAILLPNLMVLFGTALSLTFPSALSSMSTQGPHGLSEVLYALTSASNNNGSAFAGLNANTPYYNVLLGIAMLVGRFGVLIPVLALAGSLSRKKLCPQSLGSLSTESFTFGILLIGVILIVGGLTFFPSLALGPIVEHFLWLKGVTF